MSDQSNHYNIPQGQPFTICQATFVLNQGYILSNFLKSISVKSQPGMYFSNDCIYSDMPTHDSRLVLRNYMLGDEINLEWNSQIPLAERQLYLLFELSDLLNKIGRILKKEQASLIIMQNRFPGKNNFSGEGSSDDFSICIGKGGADVDGREGYQSFPAKRAMFGTSIINEPTNFISKLSIPVLSLRPMLAAFSKCKKNSNISIKYYTPDPASGRNKPGILITSQSNLKKGNVVEKFGQIPEENIEGPQQNINGQFVIMNTNEFILDTDKIGFLANFANLHAEGTVRIFYEPGKDLKLAYRYGCYGESTVFISGNRTPMTVGYGLQG